MNNIEGISSPMIWTISLSPLATTAASAPGYKTFKIMDMMLAKKRASDRKDWLQSKGDLAEL